jgi:Fic family protein
MNDHIRNSNLIENIDSEAEDQQSLLAWQFLCEQKEITHGIICKIQKIITIRQKDLKPYERGYYRDISMKEVSIAGNMAPSYRMIEGLMGNYVLDMKEYETHDPLEMHIRFEKIHPFVDGNGRTGRMLMWWHEMMLGRGPTLIEFNSREEYYELFR